MKYYCSKCTSELILNEELVNRWIAEDTAYEGDGNWNHKWSGDSVLCDICTDEYTSVEYWMERFPDFETPEQYEKRTGKKWSGAVWYRKKIADRGGINENGDYESSSNYWDISTLEHLEFLFYTKNKEGEPLENLTILCANSSEPPPDDYVPEVEA